MCDVVENSALHKKFFYCREHKVEAADLNACNFLAESIPQENNEILGLNASIKRAIRCLIPLTGRMTKNKIYYEQFDTGLVTPSNLFFVLDDMGKLTTVTANGLLPWYEACNVKV